MSAPALPVAAVAPQFQCRYLTESPAEKARDHQIYYILYQTASVVSLVALVVINASALAFSFIVAAPPLTIGLVALGGLASIKLLGTAFQVLQTRANQHWAKRNFERKVVERLTLLQGPGGAAELNRLRATCPEIPAEPAPFLPLIARFSVLREQASLSCNANSSIMADRTIASTPEETALLTARRSTAYDRMETETAPSLLHAAVLLENMRRPNETLTLEQLGEMTPYPFMTRQLNVNTTLFKFHAPERAPLQHTELRRYSYLPSRVRELLYPQPNGIPG